MRVSACNVNFHYLQLAVQKGAHELGPEKIDDYLTSFRNRKADLPSYYEIVETSRPGDANRPEVPIAIPFQASHSGDETGIVSGAAPRAQVIRLLKAASPPRRPIGKHSLINLPMKRVARSNA